MTLAERFEALEKKYGEEFNWYVTEGEYRNKLSAELKKELSEDDEILKGEVTALARSEAMDDVLFEIKGERTFYRIYHLTWTTKNGSWKLWYKELETMDEVLKHIEEEYIL